MKSLACACVFLLSCVAEAQTAVTVPTVFQIAPTLETRCLHDAPARYYAVTGTDAYGNLTGVASYWDYACALYVHSGRGPGYFLSAGCADVVWDPTDGYIVSVTPTLYITGGQSYYQPTCP